MDFLDSILKNAHKKVVVKRVIAILSVVVMLFTVNSTRKFADTLERIPACGIKEHIHTEACFDADGNVACGLAEHVHTDACYQERPKSAVSAGEVQSPVEEIQDIELDDIEQSADDDAGDVFVDSDANFVGTDIDAPVEETEERDLEDADEAADITGEEDADAPSDEAADTEAQPETEVAQGYIVGAQNPFYLSDIISDQGLDISIEDVVEVGQAVESDDAPVLFSSEPVDGDVALYVNEDFERAELAISTEAELYVIELLYGIAPMAESMDGQDDMETSAETEEATDAEEAIPSEAVESDEEQIEEVTEEIPEEEQTEEAAEETSEKEPTEEAAEETSEEEPTEEAAEETSEEEQTEEATEETSDEKQTEETAEETSEEEQTEEAAEETSEEEQTEEAAEETSEEEQTEEAGEDTSDEEESDVNDKEQSDEEKTEETSEEEQTEEATEETSEEKQTEEAAEEDSEEEQTDITAEDSAQPQPVEGPHYEATIDLAEVDAYPIALTDLMAQAIYVDAETASPAEVEEPAAAEPDGEALPADETAEETEETEEIVEAAAVEPTRDEVTFELDGEDLTDPEVSGTLETDAWTLDYDAAVLSIERDGNGYALSVIDAFKQTVVTVNNGELYTITLLNGSTPMLYPAAAFTASTDYVNVNVEAAEGAFPAGTTMVVADVEDEDTISGITDKVEEGFVRVERVHAVDITFLDANGEEIEPRIPISVTMSVREIEQEKETVVIHVDHEGEAQVVDGAETAVSEANNQDGSVEAADEDSAGAGTAVAFSADSFSVYAIVVGEKLETKAIAADGSTYRIEVTYAEDAQIPAGATLAVEEVTGDAAYLSQVAEALPDGRKVSTARFFDIRIMDGAQEVQPSAPVTVRVELVSDGERALDVVPCAVHFTDDAVDVINATETEAAVSFRAESFSVWGVVYTVDFHYEVDGKVYEFSLPGGGFVSLTDLVEALGLTGAAEPEAETDDIFTPMEAEDVASSDAAKAFVADVADVAFSSPELVDVSKAEMDTTVGQIKELRGLEVQYSAELTEERIEAINNSAVEAGDWALIGVQPFTTEESLTVTMKDGEVFTVKVTDAQITGHYMSANGEYYEITVTYGEDAGIPDGSVLEIVEFDKMTAEYQDAYETVVQATDALRRIALEPVAGVEQDNLLENAENDDPDAVIVDTLAPGPVGMDVLDISIFDENHQLIEPKAPVKVSIVRKALPEDASASMLESSLIVNHLNNHTGDMSVETVAASIGETADNVEVDEASVRVEFLTESFSTYTISWGGGLTGTGISSISPGQYIIYARDAANGNYYALLPQRNSDGTLNTVQLNYNNGVISYSGDMSNMYWTYSQYNGSYRFSFMSGNTTYYLAAGTFGQQVKTSTSGTAAYGNANTTLFGQYADHLHAAGDTFLRCYNGTFQFINDVSSGWQNRSQVFFARPADTKTVTVHYGYMSDGQFVEFGVDEDGTVPAGSILTGPTQIGDQIDLEHEISGYRYVTSYLTKGATTNPTTGTQISALLNTDAPNGGTNYDNNGSGNYNSSTSGGELRWRYRELSSRTWNPTGASWRTNQDGYVAGQPVTDTGVVKPVTFAADDTDIYVVYEKGTLNAGGGNGSGGDLGDLSAPATEKNVGPNGDGTYDVSLSVTGESRSQYEKTKANVVVVLDTSWSMYQNDAGNGQSRMAVAKTAINSLADKLFALNSSAIPDTVELAFVTFAQCVRNEREMQTIYKGTDATSFKTMINGLDCASGTNWDAALYAAQHIYFGDNDPTYIVFITDGGTISMSHPVNGAYNDWDGGTYTGAGEGAADYVAAASAQANVILNAGKKLYKIGAFGTISNLEDGIPGTYLGRADNLTAINSYFDNIINEIRNVLGYEAVTIHDGITALTSTALVNGVADQFRYKITKKGGTVQTFNSDDALQAAYPGIGTATYTTNGSEKAVQWSLGANYQLEDGVTYQLTFTVWPSQEAYDYLADFNNRVKYITEQDASVKKQFFVEVDGSMYQYVENKGWTTDIPAKDGSTYITDSAMQDKIDAATSLTHYVRTNTSASVDYTSVKTENGTVTETKTVTGAEIRDPNGKMVLDGTALKMQKAWNDSLATSELLELLTKYLNDAGTDTTYAVTLRMWQDKDATNEKEIKTETSDNGFVIRPTVTIVDGKVTAAAWPTLDVSISPGVMVESTEDKERIYGDRTRFPRVTYGTKTYIILETGHDYTLTEDDIDLHFELNADVYHPMVVNGVLKTVKFGTDASGNRIITEMSADNTALTTLTATNDLKGGLDVMKFVTTKDDASDAVTTDETYFTFKIKLQKSETDTTPVYTTEDQFNHDAAGNRTGTISGSLGFRIFAAPVIPADAISIADDKSSYEFDGLTYSANRNSEGEIISYTARGSIPSTGELTLKIRQSKLSGTEDNPLDRIRIVNIPTGTYYTVEEINVPEGYKQVKTEDISGTVHANSQATAKFWNKRTSFTVDLLKVDELDNTKVLENAEFKLYKEDGTTEATDADGKAIGTIITGSDGKATIGKLLPGTYKLIETKAPAGYILMSSPITIVVTNDKVTFQQGTKQPADATKSSDGLTWTITATNNPGFELPATGGPGTARYTITGMLLILAAATLLLRKRRES